MQILANICKNNLQIIIIIFAKIIIFANNIFANIVNNIKRGVLSRAMGSLHIVQTFSVCQLPPILLDRNIVLRFQIPIPEINIMDVIIVLSN